MKSKKPKTVKSKKASKKPAKKRGKKSSHLDDSGIIEPFSVTKNAITGAMEAAVSVLRIDDVLWANQDPSIPDWKSEESED